MDNDSNTKVGEEFQCFTDQLHVCSWRRSRHHYPKLSALVDQGTIWWNRSEMQWQGRAADGKTVVISYCAKFAEQYLQRCPTPADW